MRQQQFEPGVLLRQHLEILTLISDQVLRILHPTKLFFMVLICLHFIKTYLIKFFEVSKDLLIQKSMFILVKMLFVIHLKKKMV